MSQISKTATGPHDYLYVPTWETGALFRFLEKENQTVKKYGFEQSSLYIVKRIENKDNATLEKFIYSSGTTSGIEIRVPIHEIKPVAQWRGVLSTFPKSLPSPQ